METIVENIGLITTLGGVTVVLLLVIGYLHTLFSNGRVEVGPMQAFVYKNLWSGTPYALRMGSWLIWPGIHKPLVLDVSLKNEPFDPDVIDAVTADGIEVGIDLVVYTFQVADSPPAIVLVTTAIDYTKRQQFVLDRIEAETQAALKNFRLDQLITESPTPGQPPQVNREALNGIAAAINRNLTDNVTAPWGIRVEVKLEDIDFPGKVRETFEEMATAKRKGQALAAKIGELRGVDTEVVKWIVAAEAVAPALRSVFGGKGKKGE